MTQYKIVNKTSHPITILDEENEVITRFGPAPAGMQARLKSITTKIAEIDGIPISKTKYGILEGIPEPQEDVYYIVSQLVKNHLPNRHDLLVPAEVVRNERGHIVGCRSLGK